MRPRSGRQLDPGWSYHHIDWPDFWLPRDSRRAAQLLRQAHEHAVAGGSLAIACRGGCGRTGTAIAALAILAGMEPGSAVDWTRCHYSPRAVETPWQRDWVETFPVPPVLRILILNGDSMPGWSVAGSANTTPADRYWNVP